MNLYQNYRFPDRDFPLGIVPMIPQGPTSLHHHDFEELTIIIGGSGRHQYEGEVYDISAGDVYTIKPGMKHGYPATKDLKLTNLLFISSELGLEREDLSVIGGYHVLFDLEPRYRTQTGFQSRLRLNPGQLNRLLGMVDALNSELSAAHPGFRFMAVTELRRIVGFLSRAYSESSGKNARSMMILARAIRQMEANIAETLSIPGVAAASGVSESTLLRAFKDCTGVTPIRYLAQMRVRNACELLRNGADDIGMVAFQSGYHDSNYFSRQFRQVMGTTPKAYREKYMTQP